jgi:hypothetical protein
MLCTICQVLVANRFAIIGQTSWSQSHGLTALDQSRCSCSFFFLPCRPTPESQHPPPTPPPPRLGASRAENRPRVSLSPARPHGRRQRCGPGHAAAAAAAARVAEHRGGGGAEPPRGGRRRLPGPGDGVVPLCEPGPPPPRARRLRRGLRPGRRGGRGLALRHGLPRGPRHRHPRRRGRLNLRGGLRPRGREGNTQKNTNSWCLSSVESGSVNLLHLKF